MLNPTNGSYKLKRTSSLTTQSYSRIPKNLKNGTFFCNLIHPNGFVVGFDLLDDKFDWRYFLLGRRISTTERKLRKKIKISFSRHASVVDSPRFNL
jgi:hypothetical protein